MRETPASEPLKRCGVKNISTILSSSPNSPCCSAPSCNSPSLCVHAFGLQFPALKPSLFHINCFPSPSSEGTTMKDDSKPPLIRIVAANDNGPLPGASERVDAVVLELARMIGRQMAREDFDRRHRADNDNAPPPEKGGHTT